MGSRAIAVVCRDEAVGASASASTGLGALYTRTGRPFLDDGDARRWSASARRDRRARACGTTLETGWLVLDCELLPWSAKAMELIRRQYAAVGAAGDAALERDRRACSRRRPRAASDVSDAARHAPATAPRASSATATPTARYVWDVNGLEDLRLAPFHVLAAESGAFAARDHTWHLEHCDALVAADPDWIRRTERRFVDVTDPAAEAEATAWWEELTAGGGEGMVVKPLDVHRPRRRSPASSAAAASTCGSSTAPSTTRRPDRAPALARARPQALARRPRVRARRRGARALHPPRAALPRPRVRLRRARAGVRTGRPAPLSAAITDPLPVLPSMRGMNNTAHRATWTTVVDKATWTKPIQRATWTTVVDKATWTTTVDKASWT